MYPFQQVVHRFIPFNLALFCALFFVLIPHAHADIGQVVHDTQTTNIWNENVLQGLGTGISGTIDTGSGVYTNEAGGSAGGGFLSIREFDDETAYNNCVNSTLGSGNCGSTPGSGGYVGNTNLSLSSVGSGVQFRTISTGYTFDPTHWYVFRIGAANWANPSYALGSATDTYANGNCFVIFDNGGSPSCNGVVDLNFLFVGVSSAGGDLACLGGDIGTCINTVAPENMEVIATSTLPYDFNVTGHITSDDYEDGSRVLIKIDSNQAQQQVGALSGFDSAFGNKNYIPITASGDFDVSTSSANFILSTPLIIGLYNVRWEVESPRFSIFGFDLLYSTKASYNSRFIVGTTTAIDNIQLAQEKYLGELAAGIGDPLAACQFSIFSDALDFSLGGKVLNCMGGLLHWLIVPTPGTLETIIQQLKEGFLTRPPIGYFTRIVNVISSSTPSTLPTLTASIPTSADPDDNIDLSFNLADTVNGAATLQDSFVSPEGHTARQIIEPIIQTIVGLLVLMFIYRDIMRSL